MERSIGADTDARDAREAYHRARSTRMRFRARNSRTRAWDRVAFGRE